LKKKKPRRKNLDKIYHQITDLDEFSIMEDEIKVSKEKDAK
jgi:hypothetical protein